MSFAICCQTANASTGNLCAVLPAGNAARDVLVPDVAPDHGFVLRPGERRPRLRRMPGLPWWALAGLNCRPGEVANLGETMRGVKSFMLPDDVDLGTPGDVNVDLSIEPYDSDGRISFEGTRDLWVFGYGSLVSHSEIERTIGRPINTALEYTTATLVGYRRTWNAGMRNRHNDPTDKYYELPDGTRPDRTVSALGIEPDPDSTVNGVVFRVTRVELEAFDRRERRYRRIECSNQIVEELPAPRRVFTYMPLESAMSLTATSQADGSDTISENYKLLVERGFQSLGPQAYAEYTVNTDVPTSPVMPLRIRRPEQTARSGEEAT